MFVVWELTEEHPVVDLRLFARRNFLVGAVCLMVGSMAFFGIVVTLPLWLIPGLGLFLPLFWMAWLNRRTFAYDALAEHATPDEWRELRRQKAMPLLALGFGMAALTHVPFAGLLAPSLAALIYVHFCLESLRRLRQGAVVSIQSRSEA